MATDIYNRYLHDQGLIREDQFAYLLWLYNHHLTTFPTPDLVVYLHADDDTIRDRAIKRDGLVAHDPHELQPYWDRLLGELKERGVPVFRVNTGKHLVEATQQLILGEVERLKKEKRSLRPDVRTPVVRQFRFETTRPQ